MCARLVSQSCPILCYPTDCSPPGSSVHGLSQARPLQWIAIALSSSKGPFPPRDQTCISCVSLHWQADSLPAEPPEKLCILYIVVIHGLPSGSAGKESACNSGATEARVQRLGREDPLEEEMATHSSVLVWEIPRTEEPGGLQSMGSQRVRHD